MSVCAYIIINGIRTDPGLIDGWPDRMVTAINTLSPHKAQAAEYHTGALNRRVGHEERVRKIAKMVGFYQRRGMPVRIIAHSNGAYVTADVLAARGMDDAFDDPVESVQLFSPAVDAEMIADAIRSHDAMAFRIYWSRNDRALRLGKMSRKLFGWIKWKGRPLGYGTLGLNPWQLEQGYIGQFVSNIERTDFDHSTWFAPQHFDRTVRDILDFDDPVKR